MHGVRQGAKQVALEATLLLYTFYMHLYVLLCLSLSTHTGVKSGGVWAQQRAAFSHSFCHPLAYTAASAVLMYSINRL